MDTEELSKYRKAFKGPAAEAARGIVALLLPCCSELDEAAKEKVTVLLREKSESNRD